MKFVFCAAGYGHLELAEADIVPSGKFKGLTQKELFEKIMKEGYGKNVPANFFAEFKDGSMKKFTGKSASVLIGDPAVDEVTVLAPIMGG